MTTQSKPKECICGCHTEKYQSAPLDIKMEPIGCQHCTTPSSSLEEEILVRFRKCFITTYGLSASGEDIEQFISEVIAEVRAEERKKWEQEKKLIINSHRA